MHQDRAELDSMLLFSGNTARCLITVMPMNRTAIIFTLVSLLGCTDNGYVVSETSEEIYAAIKASNFEKLNLSTLGGDKWAKVCFLGPYNEMSEKALGFNWQVSAHT